MGAANRSAASTPWPNRSATRSRPSKNARRSRSDRKSRRTRSTRQKQASRSERSAPASTPTGLDADRPGRRRRARWSAGRSADADVQRATVTLPAGMLSTPSAANGLQACSEQQIGYEGPGGTRSARARHQRTAALLHRQGIAVPKREDRHRQGEDAAAQRRTARLRVPGHPRRGEPAEPVQLAARPVHRRRKQTARAARQARRRRQSSTHRPASSPPAFKKPHRCPSKNCSYSCSADHAHRSTTPPSAAATPTSASFTRWSARTPLKPPPTPGELQTSAGPRRRRLPPTRRPFAPSLQRRRQQPAGRRAHQLHAAAATTRRTTGPHGADDAPAAGERRAARPRHTLPRTAGRAGHLRPGERDRQRHGIAGLGPDPVQLTGARLPHRPLSGRPLRPVDRHPRRRRPVQPRRRRRALKDRSQPPHRDRDDHQQPPHDRQGGRHEPVGHTATAQTDPRPRQPAELRVQPHQLRPDAASKAPSQAPKAPPAASPPASRSPAVKTCRSSPESQRAHRARPAKPTAPA